MAKNVVVSWSGGKDSALSLYRLQQDPNYNPIGLLTTVMEDDNKVAMHNLDLSIIEQQADSVGLPLYVVKIPESNRLYEDRMKSQLEFFRDHYNVNCIASGDIFLEDLRKSREAKLSMIDFEGVFPLWGSDTSSLIDEFLHLGFQAVIVTVDDDKINPRYIGKSLDKNFIDKLPGSVDPCGENGEYHTCVIGGPNFVGDNISVAMLDKVPSSNRQNCCSISFDISPNFPS